MKILKYLPAQKKPLVLAAFISAFFIINVNALPSTSAKAEVSEPTPVITSVDAVYEPIAPVEAPQTVELVEAPAYIPEAVAVTTTQTEDSAPEPAPAPTEEQTRADAKAKVESNVYALLGGWEGYNSVYGTWENHLYRQWHCMQRIINETRPMGFSDYAAVMSRVDELKNATFQTSGCAIMFVGLENPTY